MPGEQVTRDDIRRAYETIRPYIRLTPVVDVDLGDAGAGADSGSGSGFGPVTLKLEQLQCAGSFKARGAFTNLLLRDVPTAGVAAASGGNHGAAVAYAAHRLGVPAKIFVPTVSAPAKIARIRALGADLVIDGDGYADALQSCERWIAATGALGVHAYDQRETIMGQGTLALELAGQAEVDTVLVAVGGGGLLAGLASWYAGSVRVIGVEPERCATLYRARLAGQPVDVPVAGIAADALGARRAGERVFAITESYVQDVVLVDDDAIAQAQRTLWQAARVAAEPAASAGLAALLAGAYKPAPGERIAVVISGANMNPAQLGG